MKNDQSIANLKSLLITFHNNIGNEFLNHPHDYNKTTWARIENFNKIFEKVKEINESLPDYSFSDVKNKARSEEPEISVYEMYSRIREIIIFLFPDEKEQLIDFGESYKEKKKEAEKASDEANKEKQSALIKEINKEKDKKAKKAKIFLTAFSVFLGIIFITNVVLFIKYSRIDRKIDFSEFIQLFLGQGLYFFTIEILILFIAFYFLSLYKAYIKLSETYDSFTLLIQSDDYYKNDIDRHAHTRNEKDEMEYQIAFFNMRKENSQKIHSLPEKVINIFNNKDGVNENPSSIYLLENILKAIKKLLLK